MPELNDFKVLPSDGASGCLQTSEYPASGSRSGAMTTAGPGALPRMKATSVNDAIDRAQRLAEENSRRRAFIVLWPDESITVEATGDLPRSDRARILAVSGDGRLHTIRSDSGEAERLEFHGQDT